jgi:UDP-N-acetylmuramyl pentapeptide synthase
MLADDVPGCGYAVDHAAAIEWIRAQARPGDTVLIMGARDPSLPRLARAVLDAISRRSP